MAVLVGLTGSMGSGKTTVSNMLRDLGAHIIDADLLSRQLVMPDQPAWQEIVDLFGPDILLDDRTLDRKKIAGIVFDQPEKKLALEQILHPGIIDLEHENFLQISAKNPDSVVVIDAALLIESGNYRKVDKVVVISCDEETQIQRILDQGKFSKEDAIIRIRSQLSLEEKIKKADYIVKNDSEISHLRNQVKELYDKLKQLV